MNKHRIFLTGADEYQWALKEDYDQTIAATKSFANHVSLNQADIIHAVYWEALKKLPDTALKNKFVICNLSGEWERYEHDAGDAFLNIAEKVDVWVVRSRQAEHNLQQRGYKAYYIPYTVNTNLFFALDQMKKREIRKRYKIPDETYIIGNFMRDSTAGQLYTPKLVKGPDILTEIVTKLHRQGLPIHVLLAGPRRHWVRRELKRNGVPFSFAGFRVWFDDMRFNTLHRSKLNELYNILDLSIVTSRSEAGPHAILEAAAAHCPQLSSQVGIAEDVLPKDLIYTTPDEAIVKIKEDILSRTIATLTELSYKKVQSSFIPSAAENLYRELYKRETNLNG
jgi:glycosyltransferase involved in cell wall biosynthesis